MGDGWYSKRGLIFGNGGFGMENDCIVLGVF